MVVRISRTDPSSIGCYVSLSHPQDHVPERIRMSDDPFIKSTNAADQGAMKSEQIQVPHVYQSISEIQKSHQLLQMLTVGSRELVTNDHILPYVFVIALVPHLGLGIPRTE
jgi:hypothetical protein